MKDMNMKIVAKSSIKGTPTSCSRFPGAARLKDGSIVILYEDGEVFESPNNFMRIARSQDNGRTWQDGGPMHDMASLGLPYPFTESCKPTAIGDNELIALGYGFERDEPELGLSAYAEKYGHFPTGHNTVSHSRDGGRTWSLPTFISHPYDVIEFSGPALWCAEEETLLAFGPPFVFKSDVQRGICFASKDRGLTWQEQGTYFNSPAIAPWETRSLKMSGSNRIWVVLWAFDLQKSQHLCNQLVYSDDLGKTWSDPIDTGVRGQAANLFEKDGILYLLYTKREGDDPGIYCVPALEAKEAVCLWSSPMASTSNGTIIKQFHNLKFGQPSMMPLDNGEWMLLFWSYEEPDGYSIRTQILA